MLQLLSPSFYFPIIRLLLLFLYLVSNFAGQAQHLLQGRVVDARTAQPLEFVSVFINTTTLGTTTNQQGEFRLQLPAGRHEVVVTRVGYEPLVYAVATDNLPTAVLFKLKEKEFNLQEVEVTAKRDALWYRNLAVFKEYFLGRSELGRKCKILNEKALIISYNAQERVLTVKAKEPLQILNPELGYTIEYHLVAFEYLPGKGYVSFLGYPRYAQQEGGRLKQQRWAQNRVRAYKGSSMHFVRALREQQLEEQGFYLRRLYRYPNPKRPSDEAIAAARAALRANNGSITLRPGQADSLGQILEKARLPRIVEKLDTTRVPYAEYLVREGNRVCMSAPHSFQVVFIHEKEELAYVQAYPRNRYPKPGFQRSVLSFVKGQVLLEETGMFVEPLDVVLEGYWGWEKFGDMLPLDYRGEDGAF